MRLRRHSGRWAATLALAIACAACGGAPESRPAPPPTTTARSDPPIDVRSLRAGRGDDPTVEPPPILQPPQCEDVEPMPIPPGVDPTDLAMECLRRGDDECVRRVLCHSQGE